MPIIFRSDHDQGIDPVGYPYIMYIRVCATQRGRDFEAPDLERIIHFRGVFLNGV